MSKLQRHLHARWEQSPSGAEHYWVDEEQVLVDQVGSRQRADQLAAAHDRQDAIRSLFEGAGRPDNGGSS